MSDMLETNLINLNAFWQALSAETNGKEVYFHSGWPHKVWRTNFTSILRDKWNDKVHVTLEKPISQEQVNIKTQLTAMYLELEKAIGQEWEQVSLVRSFEELQEWCNACGDAFGYEIDRQALVPLLNDKNATIVAVQVNGKIAGTAILYQSNNNMGIHQVGVLPNFQGCGIGKALMFHLMAIARKKACKTMTLQASQAGIFMYLTMGFMKLSELYHLESN